MNDVFKYGAFITIELQEDGIIKVRDEFNSFNCKFKQDDLQEMIEFFENIPSYYEECYTSHLDDDDYASYQEGDMDVDEHRICNDLDYLTHIESNYFILGRYQIMTDALKEFESIVGGKSLRSLLKEYKEKRKTK